jgi:hypothetical protein
MNTDLPESINYLSLRENGLKLTESDFKIIISSVINGISEARKYLQKEGDPLPKIMFSNDIGVMGFSSQLNAINIRMDYLNLISTNTTPIEYRDQLACYVPDEFYMILKYLQWLRLFGIEETIHYYQKNGNSRLLIGFPEKFPESLSPKTLLLSDLETEARKSVDAILTANGDVPIWKNVDFYFASKFPEYYNKPISHLVTLPKPDLGISFEIENLLS